MENALTIGLVFGIATLVGIVMVWMGVGGEKEE